MVKLNAIQELKHQEMLKEIEMMYRDLLEEEHYPIISVLSMGSMLEEVVDALCAGDDSGDGEVYQLEFTYNFPEEARAEFKDIIHNEDGLLITAPILDDFPPVFLTYDELYYYMKLYVDRYITKHPDKKEKLESCLAAYRKRFLHATE